MPALKSFNEKRSDLMVVIMAILDESIAGWLPKTSKTGGLPNISHEPRKPVSLGTLFHNCPECITGCFVYQDIQMHPEIQRTKEFFYSDVANRVPELTALPMSEEMSAHSAEVLRQVKGAGVKEGGWICGDAWFGSVMSAVECYRRLGVHSTLVIKGNNKYFPQAALRAVLLARHGTWPAGHWVVMTTEIGGVFLMPFAMPGPSSAVLTSSAPVEAQQHTQLSMKQAMRMSGARLLSDTLIDLTLFT